MDNTVKALIAIGASVAANGQPCLAYHITRAIDAGVDTEEVKMAFEVARSVRTGAAESRDRYAGTMHGSSGKASSCSGCGC